MRSPTAQQIEPLRNPDSPYGSAGSSFPERISSSVFLMVNSLETGGTERQFVELASALRGRGASIHLGCISRKGPFAEHVGEIPEFPLGGSLYGLQSIITRWHLGRHLRNLRVGLAHSFDFYANLALIPAAWLVGVPVIGSHRQIGDLLTPAQFKAQLAVFRLCDRVVCNSRPAAERLVDSGLPEEKVSVIGNALPPASFAQIPPALPPAQGTIRIGMIARMNAEYKNHRKFLRAAKIVGEAFPQVEFILVGDGPLRSSLEQETCGLGLRKRVRFLGDRRDIAAILRSLDLSVVPSESESLSNVMLESMAASVPVVASAIGGNIELGESGRAVLVPVGDEGALAEAMIRVLADGDGARQNACRARDFVASNFRAEQVGRQYEELYEEVLEQREGGHCSRPASASRSSSKTRVALVAPSLRYVGGQAVQADLLLRNWRGDPEISTSFVRVDPSFPRGLRWAERIPLMRTLVRQPIYLWNLWRQLKRVDIAHIFSASYTSFLLAPLPAWFVARSLGKKTIINYRSGEAQDHLWRSKIALHVLEQADRLVVPSGYLAGVFREFGLKADIVPNVVELSQFHYRSRSPLRPHLICTRGFHPYYGIDVVVRAFAAVQKEYPEAKLDLVGGGTLEKQIRDLVSQLNLANVNFLGIASRNEIGHFYDRADIFVNASNLDNMPVSVLEAFACGTPVVTTEPESMKYMISHENTGLLSPVGDASALSRNIIRLLREPDLAARLSQNALEASSLYHWHRVRDQWARIYSELQTPIARNLPRFNTEVTREVGRTK